MAAQVAVTLAGFAGIVVVFRPTSVEEWSAIDRFRLRLLLINSTMPLALALFGILLLSVEPPIAAIWRWCSGLSFLATVIFAIMTRKGAQLVGAAMTDTFSVALYRIMALLGGCAIVMQLLNVVWLDRFWAFFAGIFVHLIAAVAQFVRMILLPPHRQSSAE